MKHQCSLFLFLLISLYSFAQIDLEFDKNHLLFYDGKAKELVLLVNDSILYHGKDFKVKTSTNGLGSEGFTTGKPYTFIKEDKTYFVANGAGPVKVFEDGVFTRVDNSFQHRNQHHGCSFMFEDEFHLFGGFGLFTHKNIITKYNSNTGNWTQVQTFGEEVPSPRFFAGNIKCDKKLYVFAGLEQNPNKFRKHKLVDDEVVWQLDMEEMRWSKAGTYNFNLIGEKSYIAFQTTNKLYLLDDYIYEVDIINNTFTTFAFSEWKDVRRIIYDRIEDKVTYTYRDDKTSETYSIKSEPLASFIGKEMSKEIFMKKSSNSLFIGFGVFALVSGLGFGTFVYKRHKSNTKTAKIIYNSNQKSFYYKRNKISNLDESEFCLLEYLVQHKDSFVSLNQLNELFQIEDTESFSAISKRRETTMASLVFKLSTMLQVPKENIIIEQRNPTDRRLKEVSLNQELFKLK